MFVISNFDFPSNSVKSTMEVYLRRDLPKAGSYAGMKRPRYDNFTNPRGRGYSRGYYGGRGNFRGGYRGYFTVL